MNRRHVVYLACALSIMGVVDCVMTLVNLSLGATEENPLMAFLITRSPAAFVFLKCVLLPGLMMFPVLRSIDGVRTRWLAPVLVGANVAYLSALVAHAVTFYNLTSM